MILRTCISVAAILIAFLTPSGPALAGKKVALVIGNSAYKAVPQLANPSSDAKAIGEMLQRAKFDVVDIRLDQTIANFRRALREFSDKTRDADIAVVYFAGHGIEVEGVNYLIPVDAILERERDAFDEAIQLERVLQSIEAAKTLRLVVLDACRDNPFLPKMVRTSSRSLGRGLAGVEPNRPNTLIAFAAKGGSTADDGSGEHSPFATSLLKNLTRPGLDIRKALGIVRDDVMRQTGDRQEPFVYGSLGGADIALVDPEPTPALSSPALPSVVSPSSADARKDYEFALQIGTREVWEAFLSAHPMGYFADLAKAQLRRVNSNVAKPEASQATDDQARRASEIDDQSKFERRSREERKRQIEEERQRQRETKRREQEKRKKEASASKEGISNGPTCSATAADCRQRSQILGPSGVAKCSDYLSACLRTGNWTSPYRQIPGLAKR